MVVRAVSTISPSANQSNSTSNNSTTSTTPSECKPALSRCGFTNATGVANMTSCQKSIETDYMVPFSTSSVYAQVDLFDGNSQCTSVPSSITHYIANKSCFKIGNNSYITANCDAARTTITKCEDNKCTKNCHPIEQGDENSCQAKNSTTSTRLTCVSFGAKIQEAKSPAHRITVTSSIFATLGLALIFIL